MIVKDIIIILFCTTCEKQINSIHELNRVNNTWILIRKNCITFEYRQPISQFFLCFLMLGFAFGFLFSSTLSLVHTFVFGCYRKSHIIDFSIEMENDANTFFLTSILQRTFEMSDFFERSNKYFANIFLCVCIMEFQEQHLNI